MASVRPSEEAVMLTLTLNPGFVPIMAALAAFATPRGVRPLIIVGSALTALWLLLDREFGAAAAIAQMGLPVVLLNLDALNRIFGIALIIALIAIGIYSSGRRNRYEDAAILTMAGSAIAALFVGDLVSFVAAASLAGLSGAWLVFASPLEGASRAGARLLIWHGLEGLLFLVGVAFHLSAGAGGSVFARLDLSTIGGGFIFAGLMIRVGGPLAHVWLKDAIAHASPAGGGALACFTTMLGVYALARLFPAEPVLVLVGAAMTVWSAFYAVAEDDLRRAAAYAMTMQAGICVALIGVGTPLALAAAEGHAFATVLGYLALQLALGAIVERLGHARISGLAGAAGALPVNCLLLLGAGLSVAGLPGFASFATHAVALEAVAEWELRWLWALFAIVPAIVFVGLALRGSLAAYAAGHHPAQKGEAPFGMMLGAGLALFLSASVGLAPRWLYDLMPTGLEFQAFAPDRLAPQAELLGAAGVVFLLLRPTAARAKAAHLLDVDALYRGPLASAGRWAGVLTLRVYGAWQDWAASLAAGGAKRLRTLAESCDRPYAGSTGAFFQLLALAGLVIAALVTR
ncbi:MAG: proton-conducting transporter membrane subunit [Hyphomonadaceae bacterium]